MTVRSTRQRRADALELLRSEEDLWIGTANEDGDVHLIPLSFSWTGSLIIMATPAANRTTRNLRRAGCARVGVGPHRHVLIVSGPVRIVPAQGDPEYADLHAESVGFDARTMPEPWVYIELVPERIQAWQNPNELPGRDILGDGSWLQ